MKLIDAKMLETEGAQKIIHNLEFYYRNFGNEWTFEDFSKTETQKELLMRTLHALEKKGFVSINSDGNSFKILDLPNNYK